MVYLKACPRCKGDLFTERDFRETYISCLQCGHILSILEERLLSFRTQRWARVATTNSSRAA